MGFFDALKRFFGTEKGHRAESEEEKEEETEGADDKTCESCDHVGHDVDAWKS
jgi:hypothetical protein